MKAKFHLYAWGVGAGMTTLVAILLSVREQLIMVGPWVLDTLLAVLGSLTIYGGFRVYVAARKHWLSMRTQENELKAQEQARQIEAERWQVERAALLLNQHLQVSRILPDAHGYMPMLVNITEMGPQYVSLPHPVHQARISGAGQQPQLPEQASSLTQAIPTAPLFREIMPYIRDEKVVMACDQNGVVSGKVTDWLSTLVVGMPGMGKSTALYFFIAQLMMLTAKFQVLDPHASLISLKTLLPYVNRTDGCIQTAPLIEDELERRMDRYEENGGVCLDTHYMLIVDELPAIADREDQLLKKMDRREKGQFRSLIDVLRRVVCEGRKYNMYCMIVGQSIPASILPTIARDNMSSRYVFNCSADHARMAGLDNKSIDTFLPSLDGNVGRCIVAAARMKTFLGAIPLTDVDDLRYVIETTGYTRDGWDNAETVNSGGNNGNKDTEPMEALPVNISVFPKNTPMAIESDISTNGNTTIPLPEGVTSRDLEQILRAYHANWPLRDIAKLVKMEGRNYHRFKAACDYLGISSKVATNE